MEALLTREEFIGAMKFNIHKYLMRAKNKGEEEENYKKAAWYSIHLGHFMRRAHVDEKNN
jgi:hypothetical protein